MGVIALSSSGVQEMKAGVREESPLVLYEMCHKRPFLQTT